MPTKSKDASNSAAPPAFGASEEVPPWEKPEEGLDTGEEVTATTKTFLGENLPPPAPGKSTFDDTVITKPADRVHAEIFGGGESLFGEDSFLDRVRQQLRGGRMWAQDWWMQNSGLGWTLGGIIGLAMIVICAWLVFRNPQSKVEIVEKADLPLQNQTQTQSQPEPQTVPQTQTAAPEQNVAASGGLSVLTEPAGARVILDGVAQSGLTPFYLKEVAAGVEHTLELQLEGYDSYQSKVVLTAGLKNELRLRLQPKGIKLDIRSEPPNAEVRINGKVVGVTPSEGSFNIYLDANQKEVRVEVRREGYETYAAMFPVGPQGVEINARLNPLRSGVPRQGGPPAATERTGSGNFGFLNLRAKPWAIVYLNDKRLSRRTPVQRLKVNPGRHKIQFVNPQNGKQETFFVTLGGGAERSFEVDLR